jgi:hypothetical protein
MKIQKIEIERTMSIADFAYEKEISEEGVLKLIRRKKIDSVRLNGESYVYLTLSTIEWNEN